MPHEEYQGTDYLPAELRLWDAFPRRRAATQLPPSPTPAPAPTRPTPDEVEAALRLCDEHRASTAGNCLGPDCLSMWPCPRYRRGHSILHAAGRLDVPAEAVS